MSVYLYDEALLKKLHKWTGDTNLHIYAPDETKRLFQVVADETNDKHIALPLICLRRLQSFQITNINKKATSFTGFTIKNTDTSAMSLNCIPIKLDYQLDIYTRYQKEADEYVRNFIFNIINYNKIIIDVPYYDEYFEHTSTIRVGNDVHDNSNIPERLIPGQFTRYTLDINIDDAYLWDIRYNKFKQIASGEIQISKPTLDENSIEHIEPLDLGNLNKK